MAKRACDRALHLDTDNYNARRKRATLFLDWRLKKSAIEDLQKVINAKRAPTAFKRNVQEVMREISGEVIKY